MLSQKTQYALRATFELARHYGEGPVKISLVAHEQGIPQRFLEVILHQLKPEFVESRRGQEGGYYLTRDPKSLAVGEVLRFMQGPVGPVECTHDPAAREECPLHGDCAFLELWQRAERAVDEIYDKTTFYDLVERDRQRRRAHVPNFSI